MQVGKLLIQVAKQLISPPQMKLRTQILDSQTEIIKTNLRKHVEELVKIPRFTQNIAGLYEAAAYIKNEWEAMKVTVKEQKYFGPPGDPNEYKNLIVSFGPEDAPRIVLGAHYDSETISQTPGADDNASGIAGILEVSRLLKELNPKLKNRIDIVAYTNEERPHCALNPKDHEKYIAYMGSYVHAQSLKDANVPVIGAIILEMIGYYSNKANSQSYPFNALKLFYPTKADFIGALGNVESFDLIQKVKAGIKQNSSIKVRSISVPKEILPDVSRSDHDCYNILGYKALMINNTSEYRNKNYHKKTDTPDTLMYDKMAEIVKGVFSTVVKL